jgi:hypothetical protein
VRAIPQVAAAPGRNFFYCRHSSSFVVIFHHPVAPSRGGIGPAVGRRVGGIAGEPSSAGAMILSL